MSWLPIWISAGKRTHGWRGFSRRWVIMFGALVRDPGVATFESSLGAGGRSGGGVPPAVGFVLEFLHHCYGPDVGRLYYGPDLGSTVFSERDGSVHVHMRRARARPPLAALASPAALAAPAALATALASALAEAEECAIVAASTAVRAGGALAWRVERSRPEGRARIPRASSPSSVIGACLRTGA